MASETQLVVGRDGGDALRPVDLREGTTRLGLPSRYRRLVPVPADLSSAYRGLLRRIERRTWLLVAAVGVGAALWHVLVDVLATGVRSTGLPLVFLGHLGVVAAAAVPVTVLVLHDAFTCAAGVAREQAARRAEQAQAMRLEGALLVARTAAHRVNNALVPVAGYAELLARHPAVRADPRLARYAAAAYEGTQHAAAEIARLKRIVRLEEDTSVVLDPPVLDLDRSAAPPFAEPVAV